MIHREYDNDSLLLDVPEVKRLIKTFIAKSKKVKEKEYGAGDYFGKYRVYAYKFDTLIIDKGDGGEYGFGNEQYLKRKDSLIFYRQYKFENAFWVKADSIRETVVIFKKGAMIFAHRGISSKDLKELYLGKTKFDTVRSNATKQYNLIQNRLKQLSELELIE